MTTGGSACGKIILTGEYAVVFGYPGIAIPAKGRIHVQFKEGKDGVEWDAPEEWKNYALDILSRCGKHGTLVIDSTLPLGKGMGASTALVIAIARCVLGDNCRDKALAIEDAVNAGHSGLDFAVIWEEKALLYKKGKAAEPITLREDLLKDASLIDTGAPNETTAELVAWVRSRSKEPEIQKALAAIGACSERLAAGEDIAEVIRDHHRAQLILGVVSDKAKTLITKIEQEGGAAKVIGAGARTGGGGMVLALGHL